MVTTAAHKRDYLRPWGTGMWRLSLPRSGQLLAGMTDRFADADTLPTRLSNSRGLVQAEQVHGASLAAVEVPQPLSHPIPGCDGLVTRLRGLALVVRTADCLPTFVWDPVRQLIGLAHVGWRGLDRCLPMRLVRFAAQYAGSRPEDLRVAIGPSIRSCCYEVGREFTQRFGPFIRSVNGRLMCDLIGCATDQFLAAGVRAPHLVDCGRCTACESDRWWSVRRDAAGAGRFLSFIMLRP